MDEKKSSIQQRCLFVAMLSVLLTDGGGGRQLLDGRTPEERKQMAEAWDLCQHTRRHNIQPPRFRELKRSKTA